MKAVVEWVARSVPLTMEVVDISTDPQLEARYGLEIPVLLIDGKKAAKHRVTGEELRRQLMGRAGKPGGAGEAGNAGRENL
jgi:hypothetical protein